jgi:hypothetical protein
MEAIHRGIGKERLEVESDLYQSFNGTDEEENRICLPSFRVN